MNIRYAVEGKETYVAVVKKVEGLENNFKTLKLQISVFTPHCPKVINAQISEVINFTG